MSKVIYSWWMKTIVFVLCAASVSAAVFRVYDALARYESVYGFEEDFSESRYFEAQLRGMGNSLYYSWQNDEKINENAVEDYEYLIKDNDGLTVMQSDTQPSFNDYPVTLNFPEGTVYIAMTGQARNEISNSWYRDYNRVNDAMCISGIAFVLLILGLVYLLAVCGRRECDGEIKLLLIDRMPPEITAALFIGVLCLGLAAGFFIAEEMLYHIPASMSSLLAWLTALCGSAALIALLQSLVRMAKAKKIFEQSLIRKAIVLCIKICRIAFSLAVSLLRKAVGVLRGVRNEVLSFENTASAWKVYALFTGYTIALMLSVLFNSVVMTLVIVVASYIFVKKNLEAFLMVRKGVAEIKNGDLSYRIENVPQGAFLSLAEDINSIGEGLEASLEDKIKAERMKSELITNVSHDLKTPLTSIISYTELLSQMELVPEEANDYVQIVAKKSERLKNLTADLFDYSKVQSGNADIALEKIDLALLVRQALAENDEAIKNSGLQFVTDMPETAFATGDGKKLSRVLENLIGNALKYSLSGTRVYVSVKGSELEIKNIANYVMSFDEEEITERFVRGDEARTSEGSGLGLAIAKSYIEAMGGGFRVKRDGDLFKASLKLRA